jgi:hypothetical protein
MMYPLVRELAATGAPVRVPVAVTCRVLKIAKQPFYRWLRDPVSDRDWDDAQLINAAVDAHEEAPTFGYRLIADELADLGFEASERRVWRICSENGIVSAIVKRRGKGKSGRQGPPVHDDLVKRAFTADAPNRLWLTDITEHWTAWIPAIVATRSRYEASSKAVRRSAGVSQSRDFRGRSFSSVATSRRRSTPCGARSVPLGKYCRRSPLVFSLLPRCQGDPGSAK